MVEMWEVVGFWLLHRAISDESCDRRDIALVRVGELVPVACCVYVPPACGGQVEYLEVSYLTLAVSSVVVDDIEGLVGRAAR